MKSVKSALAGAAALAIAGAGLAVSATPAFADTPAAAITSDANASLGSLSFYNSSGVQVTSGSINSLQYTYAVASQQKDRAVSTNQKFTVYYALPDHTQADSQTWFSGQATTSSLYPVTAAGTPSNIANAGANVPVNTMKTGDSTIASFLTTGTMDTTAGWQNFVQVRGYDNATNQAVRSTPFFASVIQIDPTAGTWTQVGNFVHDTTTALTSSANPSYNGDSVNLSATVTAVGGAVPAGSVQFLDGTTNLGAPVAVNASGVATTSTTFTTNGAHALSAVFTPTSAATFRASTGTLAQNVNAPAAATSTAASVTGGPHANEAYTLTANVTTTADSAAFGSGTVAFYDNGSSTAVAGTVTQSPTGTFTITGALFAAGSHSIVAVFTPTDTAAYKPSSSSAQAFTTLGVAGDPCTDPTDSHNTCTTNGNIKAEVPTGTLTITTPYTAAAPLDLGKLVLNADTSKGYAGSATFNGITITDTRAGSQAWTAKALAGNLSDGTGHTNGVINGQNVGLTNLVVDTASSGFNSAASNLTVTSNPVPATAVLPGDAGSAGLGGTAKTFAQATNGQGSVILKGLLTLIAPSSTEAGVYSGVVTMTVG